MYLFADVKYCDKFLLDIFFIVIEKLSQLIVRDSIPFCRQVFFMKKVPVQCFCLTKGQTLLGMSLKMKKSRLLRKLEVSRKIKSFSYQLAP